MKKEIGKIVHFYPKISVAIVDLTDTLKIGDKISIEKGEEVVEQTVDSMQIEHKEIQEAKAGDSVGLKVNSKIKEGSVVFKVEE